MEDTLRVKKSSGRRSKKVLILVLMEDTLRAYLNSYCKCTDYNVLILVLMEDTLRDIDEEHRRKLIDVLILVLMEDTLRAKQVTTMPSIR